MKIGPQLLRLS